MPGEGHVFRREPGVGEPTEQDRPQIISGPSTWGASKASPSRRPSNGMTVVGCGTVTVLLNSVTAVRDLASVGTPATAAPTIAIRETASTTASAGIRQDGEDPGQAHRVGQRLWRVGTASCSRPDGTGEDETTGTGSVVIMSTRHLHDQRTRACVRLYPVSNHADMTGHHRAVPFKPRPLPAIGQPVFNSRSLSASGTMTMQS